MRLTPEQISGIKRIKGRSDLTDTIDALTAELTESQSRVASALEAAAEHFNQFWIDLCKLEPSMKYLNSSAGQLCSEIKSSTPRAADLTLQLKEARAVQSKLDELMVRFYGDEETYAVDLIENEQKLGVDRVAQLEAELAQEVGGAKGL